MITETGTVVAVDGNMIEIEVKQASACGTCSAKSGCGTSLVASLFPQRQRRLRFPNDIDAKIGETVILSIEEKQVVSGSMLLYLYPLIGLIVGALLFDSFANSMGMPQELFQIAGGLLGITGVLFMVHQSNRKRKTSNIQISRATDTIDSNTVRLNSLMR